MKNCSVVLPKIIIPGDAPIAYYSYDNSIASFVDTKLVAHNIGQVRIKVYSVDNPNVFKYLVLPLLML
ncbi:MAG: hypothetical protein ACLU5J_05380 [Christensenellales bacterium]